MKLVKIICLAVLLSLASCVYANVTAPLDTDLSGTPLGAKVGRSDAYSICWLVAWGDEGVQAAAKNGNISVVNHMDQQLVVVLFGLYVHHTVIVYGD
jgi:hypothetical protein